MSDTTTGAPRDELLLRLLAPRQRPVGPRPPRPEAPPLSAAQEGLWFIDQLEPGSVLYAIPLAFRMHGDLSRPAMTAAIDLVVRRHESLRTTFVDEDGEPRQRVHPARPRDLPMKDLSVLPPGEREAGLADELDRERRRVFDLAAGPLFTARLVRLTHDDHVLVIGVHHIVFDGWSLAVLMDELADTYRAVLTGTPVPERPVPQFADYAVAQREWLASEESRTQLDYWRDRLAGLPEVLDLYLGRARPAVRTTAGDWVMFELPAPLSTHVAELCGQERITVFMYLMAVCQLVLARWSSRTDIVVGTPVANRRSVADQRLVGYLANTVVMRTDLGGRPTRRELLRRVRDVALGAYAHQELPFDRVVAELRPTRRLDSSPLFQVMLVFQDNAAREVPWPGLRVEPISVATPVCMFDLSLVMRADGQGIHGALNYRTDMFSRSDVERLTADFQHVAAQVVSEPDQPIGPLSPPHGGTPRDPETTTPGGEHT